MLYILNIEQFKTAIHLWLRPIFDKCVVANHNVRKYQKRPPCLRNIAIAFIHNGDKQL
ncbi:hypothetical protein H6G76_32325 [Nostoc sp. FACHB-152]|uniref:hypothetical protein n=1 Tax=unclassified Nostoc TaxID=2593658 RepID=UPI00168A0FE2|nr:MULTISPECIES: hypothetical protein [unclassified Nostoc]MBD2451725.1 hypothetical protein [Nostoc sp. FACHB-152]MBD2473214.1 hypothetical protein [Nostoc sp. FACHB-145]